MQRKQKRELITVRWVVVDNVRRDMEADMYSKLPEDGGKKMIYKMARYKDDNCRDGREGRDVDQG